MAKKRVIIYKYVVEKFEKFADIDKNLISNDKAKHVLAYCFKIPLWLQVPVINEMVNTGFLKRENQKVIRINDKEEVFD